MTTLPNATDEQIRQIRRRAVNDVTREIARTGVRLTHEQACELGEEKLDWLAVRLGLLVIETDRGVDCTPEIA